MIKKKIKHLKYYSIFFLALLLLSIFSTASATISISDVSPVDNSRHVEIIDNPPDPGGYTNLSATLTDNTGGDDMEYYLDIWNGTSWINRQHVVGASSPADLTQDDYFFNTTCSDYLWRIRTYDSTDSTWNNQTFKFKSDCKPSPPSNLKPSNNTIYEAGSNIELFCDVSHPDNDHGAKIYNVTFHEYPSGRIIGYNETPSGWNNVTTVKCNTTFHLKDPATRYYWYTKAKDDEYWGDSSGYNILKTYYNDTEPNNSYYFQGGQLFVEEPYTDTEPNNLYYYQGATLTVRRETTFTNPVPSNGTTGIKTDCPNLQIDVNSSEPMNVDVTFQQNDSGTWQDISPTYSVTTNTTVSNLHYQLQNNQKYYWRAKAYNDTTGITFYSNVYHFTTTSYDEEEPNNSYYFQGGQLFVEEPYTDTEPNNLYYYQGADISISYQPHLTNFTPSNGTITSNFSQTLSSWLYKDGEPVHYDVYFYTNKTVDETWIQIEDTLSQQKTNKTVSIVFSYDESYDETYYWKLRVVNESLNTDFNSSTFYFSTDNYTDLEPNNSYYYQGGQIFVEHPYTDTEPNNLYYYQGAEISVGLVKKPSNPYPADGDSFGTHILESFSAYVEDTDGDDMDVTFHYASNDTVWATDYNVPDGSRAEVTNLPQLSNGSTFNWYVIADDGQNTAQSDTWTYTPQNQVPVVFPEPAEGDNFVPVRREFIGGAFEKYVRLTANVVDEEEDTIKIRIYSDDPTQPNWNDWQLRLSHESDSYEVYSSAPYIQDETTFNQTDTSYHWRVYVEDPYGSKNYYMNFTSRFLFYSYFDWIPSNPTNEDSITLIDQSENASYLEWRLNGETIASKNYSSGTHTPFNLTTNINISNIYNLTLWISNHTADCTETMHSELPGSPGYLYVDRNLSLNSTNGQAGINYVAYHLNEESFPSEFAEIFDVPDKWWLHRYDGSNWEGWFVNMTGENYTIYTWDSIAIVGNKNHSTRINISESVNAQQTKILQKGLHYMVYSNITSTTLKNLTDIGVGDEDWVYLYNTTTGQWGGYWIGHNHGNNWNVKSYDVIVLRLSQSRLITMGWI
ncbi:MAG: hypothetical protein ACOC80_04975 [Petrotogales bacterium]